LCRGRAHGTLARMFKHSPLRDFKTSPEIIRLAVMLGGEAFDDDRLIAIDEFHHVSANPDNKLGGHLGSFMARDKAHIVAMTGSYFRGDAEAALMPTDEAKFETVTYTYYEQLNGYEHLKNLNIGYALAVFGPGLVILAALGLHAELGGDLRTSP